MSTEKKFRMQMILSATMMFILMLVYAKSSSAQNVNEAYTIENFSVLDNPDVIVRTSGGSITVVGSESDEVTVEMYVRRRGGYIKYGDADLKNWDIKIEKKGNKVLAEAKRKNNRGFNWNSDYTISFVVKSPKVVTTDIATSGGSLSFENLTGYQQGKTSGGRISAEGITGSLDIRTSGGTISVKDSNAKVDGKTSGGAISIENVIGEVDVNTSGGRIKVENHDGDIRAKTSGGSISAEVVNPHSIIDLKTSGGSITVSVPGEKGYDLDLDGGRVRGEVRNFTGKSEKNEIKGKMNGGGTQLIAKTSGGTVTLRYL